MFDNSDAAELSATALLSIAAELATTISGNEAHAAAITSIVEEYLELGDVDSG